MDIKAFLSHYAPGKPGCLMALVIIIGAMMGIITAILFAFFLAIC